MFSPEGNPSDQLQSSGLDVVSNKPPAPPSLQKPERNSGKAKYKCDLCTFATSYQSNYYRHRKHIHGGDGKLQYQCPRALCEFSTASFETLSSHTLAIHKSAEPPAHLGPVAAAPGKRRSRLDVAKTFRPGEFVFPPPATGGGAGASESFEDSDEFGGGNLVIAEGDQDDQADGPLPVVRCNNEDDASGVDQLTWPRGFEASANGQEASASREHARRQSQQVMDSVNVVASNSAVQAVSMATSGLQAMAKLKAEQTAAAGTKGKRRSKAPIAIDPMAKRPKMEVPSFTNDQMNGMMAQYTQAMQFLAFAEMLKYNSAMEAAFKSSADLSSSGFINAPFLPAFNGVDFSGFMPPGLFPPVLPTAAHQSTPSTSSDFSSVAVSKTATPKQLPPAKSEPFSGFEDRRASASSSAGSQTPSAKHFLAEQEAIESPSLSGNMQEIESDADIKARTCSICGYQGKWISEMIRHKRVHTTDRPYRCKYCSRTSKWKADLIRHVAKVHNVRVVSKYSRSKTFGSDTFTMRFVKEANGYMDATFSDAISERGGGSSYDRSSTQSPSSNNSEDYDMSEDPIDDPLQDFPDDPQPPAELSPPPLLQQPEPPKASAKAPPAAPKAAGRRQASLLNSIEAPNIQKYLAIDGGAAAPGSTGPGGEVMPACLKCKLCAYATKDLHTFRAHVQKHENKKPYQCSQCGYRSNWSSDVHKHIRLKKYDHNSAYVIKLLQQQPSSDDSNAGLISPLSAQAAFSTTRKGRRTATGPFSSGSASKESTPKASKSRKPAAKGFGWQFWRCGHCSFKSDARAEAMDHLCKVHNLPAYSCPFCSFTSLYRKPCIFHLQTVHGSPATSKITENLISEFRNGAAAAVASVDGIICQTPAGEVDLAKQTTPIIKNEEAPPLACDQCVFVASSDKELAAHAKGHQHPTGLVNYKCVFCFWFAKKKQAVFEHMLIHTDDPGAHMAEVEKNLITAASLALNDGETKATVSSTVIPSKEAALGASDVGDIFSDFSAILNAAGDEAAAGELRSYGNARHVMTPAALYSSSGALDEEAWGEIDKETGEFVAKTTKLPPFYSSSNVAADFTDGWSPAGNDTADGYLSDSSSISNSLVHISPEAPGSNGGNGSEIPKVTVTVNGQKNKRWQCRYCPHVSKRRANIRMHEKKHIKQAAGGHVSSTMKCPKCNFIAEDRKALNNHYSGHLLEMESAPPREFPCSKCPAVFLSASELKSHSHAHGASLEYECPQCDFSSHQSHQLMKHLAVHSFSPPATSLPLNGYDQPTGDGLMMPEQALKKWKFLPTQGKAKHTNRAPTAPPAHSPFIAGGDNSTASLDLLALSKPKKHQCSSCPAKFTDRTQLMRHERFHGTSMEFSCRLCDYSVPFPINLRKHLKAHHGLSAVGDILNFRAIDKDGNLAIAAAAAVSPPDDGLLPVSPAEEGEEYASSLGQLPEANSNSDDATEETNPSLPSGSPPLRLKINLANMSCCGSSNASSASEISPFSSEEAQQMNMSSSVVIPKMA